MNKRAFAYYLLIMFVFPVLSLAHGLRSNLGMKFKRKLLIVFITIYGSVITISESNDGFRHQERVYSHYVDLSFVDFFSEIFDILFFRGNPNINDDLYIHVISYLTGGALGMPGLFFIVVSFVYAYFFAGSIVKLFYLTENKIKYNWLFYGLALVFILWKNIEGINTVRTWTGLWVLFYGCLGYYQTKKRKYALLMFIPPFIHVAYFIMAIPAWIVLFFGVRRKLYIVIFGLSFFTLLLNPQSVKNQISTTELGVQKVHSYDQSREERVQKQLSDGNITAWYARLYKMDVQNWGLNIISIVFIMFLLYKNSLNTLEASFFSIGLLAKALSNSTDFLYSLSSRSAIVSSLFILAMVVLFIQRDGLKELDIKKQKWVKLFLSVATVLFLPFIIYRIADMIYFVSIYMLAFPFIPWFIDDINYSIREFLGLFI